MLNNILNNEEEFRVTTAACCEEVPAVVNVPGADPADTEALGKGPFGHF